MEDDGLFASFPGIVSRYIAQISRGRCGHFARILGFSSEDLVGFMAFGTFFLGYL